MPGDRDGLPEAEAAYFCEPPLPEGGGLAGGLAGGVEPLPAGAAGGVEPLPLSDGLAIEPDEELSEAPEAGALLCEEAGGAAAGWVLEDEGVFAQAASNSAAASALRATLVFIDGYPDAFDERARYERVF
jgi:hypothetical protein